MKKIVASILLCAFACALISSCAPKTPIENSSTAAESEKNSSTITTTSEIVSDTDTESEKPSDSSSKKEDNTSKKPTSSKITVGRPGSSTQSGSIKVAVADRMDIVMCGFAPSYADYYGTDRKSGIREMEDIIATGYVNALSIGVDGLKNEDIWELVVKYDLGVWCSAWAVFDSKKKTLEQYTKNINEMVAFVKQNDEWWSRFKGFWYDEKVWRRETNEDFIAETKYVYQKFGKRTYAVLATGEFSPIEGNAGITGDTVSDDRKIKPEAFRYITDVGFDSYGIDVRDGALNNDIARRYEDIMPGIVDGKSYYREYTKRLLNMIDHPVNLWYLPCAYTCTVSGGLNGIKRADEGYCLAHLDFFHGELEQQEHAGGLMLYVYGTSKESEAKGTKGLQHFLAVEADYSSDEMYKLYIETPKWRRYSERLREIVKKYNSEKANVTNKV